MRFFTDLTGNENGQDYKIEMVYWNEWKFFYTYIHRFSCLLKSECVSEQDSEITVYNVFYNNIMVYGYCRFLVYAYFLPDPRDDDALHIILLLLLLLLFYTSAFIVKSNYLEFHSTIRFTDFPFSYDGDDVLFFLYTSKI